MPRLTAPIAVLCAGITAACVSLPWYSEESGDVVGEIFHTTGFEPRFHGTPIVSLAVAAALAVAVSWVGGRRAPRVALVWAQVSRAAIVIAAAVTLFDLLFTACSDWWDEQYLGCTTGLINPGIYLTLVASVVGTILASLRVAEVRASGVEHSSA